MEELWLSPVPPFPGWASVEEPEPVVVPVLVPKVPVGVPRTLEEAKECIRAVAYGEYGGLAEELVRDVLDLLSDEFDGIEACEACSSLLETAAMDMHGWGEVPSFPLVLCGKLEEVDKAEETLAQARMEEGAAAIPAEEFSAEEAAAVAPTDEGESGGAAVLGRLSWASGHHRARWAPVALVRARGLMV